MTDEQKRIKVAEACGWVKWDGTNVSNSRGYLFAEQLPDYQNSLDAMHEAEKILLTSIHQKRNYLEWLGWEDDYMGTVFL